MNNPFDLLAFLLGLAAVLGLLNYWLLRLPSVIGLLVGALGFALLLITIDHAVPSIELRQSLRAMLERVDLSNTLLNGFLSFLLFAGALEVDFADLLARKWTVLALALVGTVLSTLLVAAGMLAISAIANLGLPLVWCLVFGALISPTDPVSVLEVLRRVGIPRPLQATVAGESLFNDGIGVVLFTVVIQMATGATASTGVSGAIALFLIEAVGGGVLGLVGGWLAFITIRRIEDRNLELMISLALVAVTYSLAGFLGVSGPVAVVVAGILIGNHGARLPLSADTREHLQKFWSLIDVVLNSLLFLLIGLEVASIELDERDLIAMAAAIPLCLAARWLSVAASALPLNLTLTDRFSSLAILTWGGLRGGISVALALSLPSGPVKDVLLTACYGVVVFTLIVQGLTLRRVAAWLLGASRDTDSA
jgi:CPA1 family monovalent cation:H+ antiporter